MGTWIPVTFEDRLIAAYAERRGGKFLLEVPIGSMRAGWPRGSGTRRIDAIGLPDSQEKTVIPRKELGLTDFTDAITGVDVELIEAKRDLNRLVIGQVVAGFDMLAAEYKPRSVTSVVLCSRGDPALEWVCQQRSIQVEIFDPVQDLGIE